MKTGKKGWRKKDKHEGLNRRKGGREGKMQGRMIGKRHRHGRMEERKEGNARLRIDRRRQERKEGRKKEKVKKRK